MIYLTRTRLMDESERTVHDRAVDGDEIPRRVCSQLLADASRYALWLSRHGRRMTSVAERGQRERQMLTLRALAVEQIHGTALVRYLREYRITGAARAQTLQEFYGVTDARRAVLSEHRNYLISASSQWCALDLLDLVGDARGVELIQRYEQSYGQYFAMFCDRARAKQHGTPYYLSGLIPEVRSGAERLRGRILDGHLLPPRRASLRLASGS
jgi:hypothetical protein